MKRTLKDLLEKGFTAEDFTELMGPGQGGPRIDVYAKLRPEVALLIAQQATAILREAAGEMVPVLNWKPGSPAWFEHTSEELPGFTRTAYLVGIAPITEQKELKK